MSVWAILRKKRIWIAVGVSAGLLLLLWALGAILIEKGTLPVKMQSGWIAGSLLCAGFLGGLMACEKKSGTLASAIALSMTLIILEVLLCWILYGGISFGGDTWKNMAFLLAGSLLAGIVCAGRRRGGKRRSGRTTKQMLQKRR